MLKLYGEYFDGAEIYGAWGSERESLPIPYGVSDAIDDYFSDLYECQRG